MKNLDAMFYAAMGKTLARTLMQTREDSYMRKLLLEQIRFYARAYCDAIRL